MNNPYDMFDDSDKKDQREESRAEKLEEILALPDVNLEQVAKLLKAGHNDSFIADFLGMHINTFKALKRKYPVFANLCGDWRKYATENVEKALYQRAVGYEHPEVKVFNNEGMITTHEVTKHYAPDTGAIKYWLNNQKPKDWKEKQEVELTTNDNMAEKILKARERLKQAKKDPKLKQAEEDIFE